MIVDIISKKDFFKNGYKECVFIHCFPMLYAYEEILLKELKHRWPKLRSVVLKRELSNRECAKFVSNFGELHLISLKLAEPGNIKETKKVLKNINSIVNDMDYPINKIARVYLTSFNTGISEQYKDEILKIFSISKRKFEIYD